MDVRDVQAIKNPSRIYFTFCESGERSISLRFEQLCRKKGPMHVTVVKAEMSTEVMPECAKKLDPILVIFVKVARFMTSCNCVQLTKKASGICVWVRNGAAMSISAKLELLLIKLVPM